MVPPAGLGRARPPNAFLCNSPSKISKSVKSFTHCNRKINHFNFFLHGTRGPPGLCPSYPPHCYATAAGCSCCTLRLLGTLAACAPRYGEAHVLFQRFHARLNTDANEPKRRLRRRTGRPLDVSGLALIYLASISRSLLANARRGAVLPNSILLKSERRS